MLVSKRTPSRIGIALSGLAIALSAVLAQAQIQAPRGAGVALADGVVIDAARETAYLMSSAGGIDAVDLATGAVRWTSTAAQRPLLVTGDRLVAQRRPDEPGALELVVLDVGGAGRQVLTARLGLPSGLWGTVQDRLGASFRARGADVDGERIIAWEALLTGADQGYRPGLGEGTAPSVDADEAGDLRRADRTTRLTGAARLDLASGRLQPLSTERAARARPPYLDLAPGVSAAARTYRSADGRHLLTSERDEDAHPGQRRFRWTLTARASSAAMGSVELDLPVAPFLVVGSTLLYEAGPSLRRADDGDWDDRPRQLRAVDLARGTELWSRDLLDPEYRGPFPP